MSNIDLDIFWELWFILLIEQKFLHSFTLLLKKIQEFRSIFHFLIKIYLSKFDISGKKQLFQWIASVSHYCIHFEIVIVTKVTGLVIETAALSKIKNISQSIPDTTMYASPIVSTLIKLSQKPKHQIVWSCVLFYSDRKYI